MNRKDIERLLSHWHMSFGDFIPHAECYGSPERSQFRCVLKNTNDDLYLLEQLRDDNVNRKNRIAQNLALLKNSNPKLPIHPYCRIPSSLWVLEIDQQYWMLSPYIPATPLHRPAYLEDAWRGVLYAQFLLELRHSAESCAGMDQSKFLPKLETYILSLAETIEVNEIALHNQLKPFIHHLKQNFFPLLPLLPHSFSHGDCHPLNLLWENKNLCAVIDWEFSGFHPELYDLANLIGCLGMEHPSALEKEISLLLIKIVKNAHIHSTCSWESFLDLVLAIRFAWLSEWLRKKDKEMIALEVCYMNLLKDNASIIKKL